MANNQTLGVTPEVTPDGAWTSPEWAPREWVARVGDVTVRVWRRVGAGYGWDARPAGRAFATETGIANTFEGAKAEAVRAARPAAAPADELLPPANLFRLVEHWSGAWIIERKRPGERLYSAYQTLDDEAMARDELARHRAADELARQQDRAIRQRERDRRAEAKSKCRAFRAKWGADFRVVDGEGANG